jgi:PadR family transcriptional regulator, regulatory protein PadR
MHGYGIAQRIRQLSSDALRVSLYPALQKMLMKGWVRAAWGISDTGRRVRAYRLTPADASKSKHVNQAIRAVLKLARRNCSEVSDTCSTASASSARWHITAS